MTRMKCINSLRKEHQCWKRHHFAGVPSESIFQGVLKAMYLHLQPPKSSGVSCDLNPLVFSPSISPSVHLRNYNFRHQLLFLLPFLVPHHDYCLSSATKDLCNTPLLLLQNNSDQAKKHLSTHHFLPNWVHWSLSWQHLKENRKKRDYIMNWMVQELLFAHATVKCEYSSIAKGSHLMKHKARPPKNSM